MALIRSAAPPAGDAAPLLDLAALRMQLAAADANGRRQAARALAAHPEAAAELAWQLDAEPDASVRAALFSSLARIGGDAAVDAVLPLLRSSDAGLRNGAIDVLAHLPEATAPHIAALLGDADGDVRIFAVNLLGQLRHPQVPQWLAQVLQEETEANVVGAALDVAAELAGPELAAPLRAALARFPSDPFIAFAAGLALRRIAPA